MDTNQQNQETEQLQYVPITTTDQQARLEELIRLALSLRAELPLDQQQGDAV